MSIKSKIRRCVLKCFPLKYWPDKLLELFENRAFYKKKHYYVNFKHPSNFSEKIQWYKIHYWKPEMNRIVDKCSFKDYVRERLGDGYTAKLYAVWKSPDEVDLSALTPPYVLKSNCSSDGKNIIVVKEMPFDESEVLQAVKSWFDPFCPGVQVNNRVRACWSVKPCVLAEEYLDQANGIGTPLIDYKFFCFDGKPYCAYTCYEDEETRTIGSKMAFYAPDWSLQDVRYVYANNRLPDLYPIPAPIHLEDMKRIASQLSKGFPFVRVDFYETTKGLKLGEMTLFSGGGMRDFSPESFDNELGKQFHLPCDE